MAKMQKCVNGVVVDLTDDEIMAREKEQAAAEAVRLENLKKARLHAELPSHAEQVEALWDWQVHGNRELLDDVQRRIKEAKERNV